MSPIEQMLKDVDFQPVEPSPARMTDGAAGPPYATHAGVFKFADIELRCYRLSDGRAIFHADDFRKAFGAFIS